MRPVVITGAAGNLGARLRSALEAKGGYALRLVDRDARGDPAIVEADLASVSDRWEGLLEGADAVVHLAANPSPAAPWSALIGPNVDAVLNLYQACARKGVSRVVLASSVWAMAGRFRQDATLEAGPPDPGENAYGATKLFGERVARSFAAAGVATVALRLGGCAPGANIPTGRHEAWENECWLSGRDFVHAVERALTCDIEGFHVVNVTSANAPSRWSLKEARDLLGYAPQDANRAEAIPSPSPLKGLAKRLLGRR